MWGGVWMHIICSFHRHHFLQNSSCFCIVPFVFEGCFCHSIPARVQHLRMQSYRRAASTSWLHGCGSACVVQWCIQCFPILKQHQLQHVLLMFHVASCHNLLCARCRRLIGPWTFKTCTSADFDCQIAQTCVASCQLCPGVMSTIHGWYPLSRKPCKDIWMSSACRRTAWLVCWLLYMLGKI